MADEGVGEVRSAPSRPDNWASRATGMVCNTCVHFIIKANKVGRCRRHAPTMTGFPVVYTTDFCGDHRLDEQKV